jgi:hypothetical protein
MVDLRAPADGADLIRLPAGRIERRQVLEELINEVPLALGPGGRL